MGGGRVGELGDGAVRDGVRELIPAIMKGADAFAARAPQHDDMTLVVTQMTG